LVEKINPKSIDIYRKNTPKLKPHLQGFIGSKRGSNYHLNKSLSLPKIRLGNHDFLTFREVGFRTILKRRFSNISNIFEY
jgi:hypothetical protein